ncbi:MAG: transglycosylase SLT domain-containing protein [Acidobacteria bacterium]|nr:transglycosylase SLT domain-containing protein [Acidobacteriota bacterium]
MGRHADKTIVVYEIVEQTVRGVPGDRATRVGAGVLVLLLAAPAQIYSWREADGVLVVSDRPHSADLTALPVQGATAIRATRAAPAAAQLAFSDIILRESNRHRIRPELVRAVIQVESAFNPRARSSKGAMGLMQLMPGTAADLQVADAFDPAQNIRGGVKYLRTLLDRFDGSEELALAAYNAGPGAVARHGNRVPPFTETQNYVAKVRSSVGTSAPLSPGGLAATGGQATLVDRGHTIYKSYAVVNGQRIRTYSDVPPRTPPPPAASGEQ